MEQRELHEKFGVTAEELDMMAAEYESDDWSRMQFGEVIQGRPRPCDEELKTITLRVPACRVAAMQRAAEREGITRSEFVRKAIDNELLAEAI